MKNEKMKTKRKRERKKRQTRKQIPITNADTPTHDILTVASQLFARITYDGEDPPISFLRFH
jgi:hypothetical protein